MKARQRGVGIALVTAILGACIPATPRPPIAGYGDPYRGTGKPIYLKDSRTDREITEGGATISSEQALEASGDTEYETRRQIAKRYNAKLYVEGRDHRKKGNIMIATGLGLTLVGLVLGAIVPVSLQEETITPATATMPETRLTKPGGASYLAAFGTFAMVSFGLGGMSYGYLGGKKPPPYHRWRTPQALDRPAYIRQHTEEYNEKIGAPAVQDQPGGVEDASSLAPGQRRPPPPRPGKGAR